jgi:translation initiation factor IF-2
LQGCLKGGERVGHAFRVRCRRTNRFECGIGIAGYQDVKLGDVIEAFVVEEIAATLS